MRVLVSLVCVSLLLIAFQCGVYAAPVQWSGNGHWYEAVLVPEGITWTTAANQAQTRGGYLATITSAEENQFVYDLVAADAFWNNGTGEVGDGRSGPWLGGFQLSNAPEPAGDWRWVTGEAWSYTNWNLADGEPNNLDGVEDMLHFTLKSPLWNDCRNDYTPYAMHNPNGYIVEWNSQPQGAVQWLGNNHWYEAVLVPTGIDWVAAQNEAYVAGGYLATLASAAENDFVYDLVAADAFWNNGSGDVGDGRSGPWLGGIQAPGSAEPDGGWHWESDWLTGEPWSYTNWNAGEPNNVDGVEEVLQFTMKSSSWNDCRTDYTPYGKHNPNGFIVEWAGFPYAIQTQFEDDNSAIACSGAWAQYNHAAASAGHLKYSNQTGARAVMLFFGAGIKWQAARGPQMGKARIYLDGSVMGLVDLYRATQQLTVLQKTGLAAGPHLLIIEVSGQKNPASGGKVVTLDYLEVTP